MAVIGLLMAKPALELMGTPDDVIAKSTLYMRIYFCGMPFFMLYNYGAAILRAVGDTKRPLIFLLISGVINAILNLFLVIQFHLDVAGVGIATVISQLISCILVLRCLYCSESSYQFRPEKLNLVFRLGSRVPSSTCPMLCCSHRLTPLARFPWQDIQQPTIFLDFCMCLSIPSPRHA